MIYSRKHRILFAHVSRTGGMTVTQCLQHLLPDCESLLGQHEPLAAARPILGALFEDTFKFAFVRNPWERFVSWFALIGQTTTDPGADKTKCMDPDNGHWRRFDSFLESWAAETTTIDGVRHPLLSQWGQLSDGEGRLLTNGLGRFELLSEDLPRLLSQTGIACPALPTINASRHQHYSTYYSDAGRELIAQVFHEDIERFGYGFEYSKGEAAQ